MVHRFSGTLVELKSKLALFDASVGDWIEVNQNQHQFHHKEGGVMNWFPSTGTINFQGKPANRDKIERLFLLSIQSLAVEYPEKVDDEVSTAFSQTHDLQQPELTGKAQDSESLKSAEFSSVFLESFSESELIIGLVGAVGTDMNEVISVLKDRLTVVGYITHEIRVSKDVIPQLVTVDIENQDVVSRFNRLMDAGNEARKKSNDNGILASGVAAKIAIIRANDTTPLKRTAFIVNSLKHPEEVLRLRQIYPRGFYLFGIHPDEPVRSSFLKRKGVGDDNIALLVERDQNEHLLFGQRVNDTFHLSDFFVRLGNNKLQLENSLLRIFDILFGDPYKTPTFDEFAMFLAFTSSLRSADLSRQVGAVIARGDEILATGANDCPKYGGGLYWPQLNPYTHEIEDKKDGRDYQRGEDSNKIEQQKIIDEIISKASSFGVDPTLLTKALEQSRIRDLTEYGRVVHAEMDALLTCSRNNTSTRDGQIFCTTFPCHNCAKHIIAAGIKRVVFIEPYQKSKAIEFHTDTISVGFNPADNTVHFEPFVGVGPRRFFDLFSVRLGDGYPLKRKDKDGLVIPWKLDQSSKLRVQMIPGSYLDFEKMARSQFEKLKK